MTYSEVVEQAIEQHADPNLQVSHGTGNGSYWIEVRGEKYRKFGYGREFDKIPSITEIINIFEKFKNENKTTQED